MRLELHPVDPDACVPVTVDTPSGCASLGTTARLNPPPKNPGVGVIVQQTSQRFDGKVSAFHFRLFRLRMAAIPNF